MMTLLPKRLFLVLFVAVLAGFFHCLVTSATHERKHTLIRASHSEPESLDPQKVQSNPAINIVNDLFEGLVTRDRQNKIVPAVACRWSVSQDKMEYTFHLCNIKWSDGVALTARDFVFAWRRAVNPATASPYAWYPAMAGIKNASAINSGTLPIEKLGVEAVDGKTLKVTLERPIPWFIDLLAQPVLFPVPEHVINRVGNRWLKPENLVGNGAYILKKRMAGGQIILTKNPCYRESSQVSVPDVVWQPVAIDSTALRWFETGALDITTSVPSDSFSEYKKRFSKEIFTVEQLGTEYIVFNVTKAPFNNKALRQALAYAIDREVITRRVLGQGQIPALGFTPYNIKSSPAYVAPYGRLTKKERIALARKRYEDAGYSRSAPLSITLLYNTDNTRKKMLLAIAEMWKRVLGIHVRLENMEWKVLLERLREGRFQVARASWIADYDEASSMLGHFSNEQTNKAGYDSKEYNAIFANIYGNDIVMRRTLYKKLEAVLAEDMPIVPLYYYVNPRLVSSRVKGYYSSPMDQVHSRYLRLKQDAGE